MRGAVILTCLVRSLAFPLIRQFSRWSNCHPLRQAHRRSAEKAKPFGFFLRLAPRIAASPRGKAFGRPHPMKQCAAPVFLPLLRGRWREAPDEVVDVNERPLIRHSGFAAKRWLPLGEGFWRLPNFPYEGKVDRGGETYPRWMRWQRVNTLSPSSFSQTFSFFTAQREKLLTKLTIRAILHNSRQGLRPRINPRRRNAGGSV